MQQRRNLTAWLWRDRFEMTAMLTLIASSKYIRMTCEETGILSHGSPMDFLWFSYGAPMGSCALEPSSQQVAAYFWALKYRVSRYWQRSNVP
jgi:hypothetical protein